MLTYRQRGHLLDYTPASDLKSGDVVILKPGSAGEALVGVAVDDIATGETGAVSISGVHELPIDADETVDVVAWDSLHEKSNAAGGLALTSASGDAYAGTAVEEADVSEVSKVKVLLNDNPGPSAR